MALAILTREAQTSKMVERHTVKNQGVQHGAGTYMSGVH